MTRGINKVILVGFAGNDAETRYTQSGSAITTLSLATSEKWTDKQSQEKKERTEWHRVKLFGKLGEIAGEYVKKGRQVYIEGSIRTEKYTDKEGVERFAVDIVANEMQLLGTNDQATSRDGERTQSRAPATQRGAPATEARGRSWEANEQTRGGGGGGRGSAPAPPQSRGAPVTSSRDQEFEEDDVPFLRFAGVHGR